MKLEIFDKYTRKRIDLIRTYDYVTYEDVLNDRGKFEITLPINERSMSNIKTGNYIWFEDGIVGIIKGIKDQEDDATKITIYGYLSNHLLEYRSFLTTTSYYDKINVIARTMVDELFINPTNIKRKINFITLSSNSQYNPDIPGNIRVQNTGDKLLDFLDKMLTAHDLGFELYPIIGNYQSLSEQGTNLSSFEFRLLKPVNRTINNEDQNVPVIFSFDFNNIERIEKESDERNYCNIAIVAGEGTGEDRVIVNVGDEVSEGIDRIELYVDARDLQSDADPENPMTEEEYEQLLVERGEQKLQDCQKAFSFDATILEGKYKYGTHFYKGDYVSIIDKNKTIYDVQITSVRKTYSQGVEHLDIFFGKDTLKIRELEERRLYNV